MYDATQGYLQWLTTYESSIENPSRYQTVLKGWRENRIIIFVHERVLPECKPRVKARPL